MKWDDLKRMNEWTRINDNEWMNEWVSEWLNEWINHWMKEGKKEIYDKWMKLIEA